MSIVCADKIFSGRTGLEVNENYQNHESVTLATGATVTLANNSITLLDYTGGAACAATLPAAELGAKVSVVLTKTVGAGTDTLSFDCAGSDVYETGCVVDSRSGTKVLPDTSQAGETLLTLTPTADNNNFADKGTQFDFACFKTGFWYVSVKAARNSDGTAQTGTLLFSA